MAKKRTTEAKDESPPEPLPPSDVNGNAEGSTEAPAVNGQEPTTAVNGNGKKQPAYKVGPLATGKGESVGGCVWENEYEADGRSYTVHSIVLEVSYYSEKEKKWMPSKGIRPSQLAAVEYVLRVCGDFAFRRRDPQQECPF